MGGFTLFFVVVLCFLVSSFNLCLVVSTSLMFFFRLSSCFEMLEIAPICSWLFYVFTTTLPPENSAKRFWVVRVVWPVRVVPVFQVASVCSSLLLVVLGCLLGCTVFF